MNPRSVQPTVKQVWNAAAVAANTPSAFLDSGGAPFVSAFGHVSAACTVSLLASDDGVTGYVVATQVLSAAGDYGITGSYGAQFFALEVSAPVTATGILSAK